MKRRPIALLTDFGAGDPYLAAMKGVILSLHPGAVIADVTHEVPRHDIVSAAYALHCVERFYPPGTIFACVVDPGVGSDRPIVCLERGGRLFIAPGNGLLNHIAAGRKGERWHALRPPAAPGSVSDTFHGRDIIAPAAARLARGSSLRSIAAPIDTPAPEKLFADPPARGTGRAKGRVLHVDHFGNIVTNITVAGPLPAGWSVSIAGTTVRRAYRTYDEAPPRVPFLIRGSSDLLEISLRRGDAAKTLRVSTGDTLYLRIV